MPHARLIQTISSREALEVEGRERGREGREEGERGGKEGERGGKGSCANRSDVDPMYARTHAHIHTHAHTHTHTTAGDVGCESVAPSVYNSCCDVWDTD